tara:strand:- start:705 stop:1388 length:684 start_codon:yes stop_codon:yes gene_type:complete
MNPTIIFEDTDILVIDKPAGLMVHDDGRTNERTLSDWVLKTYPKLQDVGEHWEGIPRPGIVHRLDKETSGVMVLAKTQKSFEMLKEQFKKRQIKKTYRAFVYDQFNEVRGEIDRPIGKSKSDFRKWSAQPGSRGLQREAHTAWEVLDTIDTYTYLELKPTTGRTHQLRVHLKAIHHPIVCDALYASKRECGLNFKRLALHAHTITIGGNTFKAPLPQDFKEALGCSK